MPTLSTENSIPLDVFFFFHLVQWLFMLLLSSGLHQMVGFNWSGAMSVLHWSNGGRRHEGVKLYSCSVFEWWSCTASNHCDYISLKEIKKSSVSKSKTLMHFVSPFLYFRHWQGPTTSFLAQSTWTISPKVSCWLNRGPSPLRQPLKEEQRKNSEVIEYWYYLVGVSLPVVLDCYCLGWSLW